MQCKSVDVCRGKMSLCAVMIMCVQLMLVVDFVLKVQSGRVFLFKREIV